MRQRGRKGESQAASEMAGSRPKWSWKVPFQCPNPTTFLIIEGKSERAMTVTSEEVCQDSHEEARCEDTEQHQEEFERRNTRNYELEKLVPFLFDSLPDKGIHFQKLLLLNSITDVRDLYAIGTYKPSEIVSMFGHEASKFREHIAVIMTFSDYLQ